MASNARINIALAFTNETDQHALLSLKDSITVDPFSILSSWNHSLHFCLWRGVACSPRRQRVTVPDLSSQRLVGQVSPHIGNLFFSQGNLSPKQQLSWPNPTRNGATVSTTASFTSKQLFPRWISYQLELLLKYQSSWFEWKKYWRENSYWIRFFVESLRSWS